MPRKERSNAMDCYAYEDSSPRSFSYLFPINNPALYIVFCFHFVTFSNISKEFFSLVQQSNRAKEVRCEPLT